MSIFAIGDLHLPGHSQKPMNVFGSHWDRHFETISEHWRRMVAPTDVVLIPGDISWAMQLEEAMDDLRAIAALPGKKLLLRGNHDYWWSSLSKLRAALPQDMLVIQNDAVKLDGHVFCGTRGWTFPTPQQPLGEQDEKIFRRELMRLRMSLDQAVRLAGEDVTVMMHYPPLFADGIGTAFTDILEEYAVNRVVYGHLHGAGIKIAFRGLRGGIDYVLASCDALGFCPVQVAPKQI